MTGRRGDAHGSMTGRPMAHRSGGGALATGTLRWGSAGSANPRDQLVAEPLENGQAGAARHWEPGVQPEDGVRADSLFLKSTSGASGFPPMRGISTRNALASGRPLSGPPVNRPGPGRSGG